MTMYGMASGIATILFPLAAEFNFVAVLIVRIVQVRLSRWGEGGKTAS